MDSKHKDTTSSEDREQFLYAQDRIRQKKRLNQHFIFFLVGSVFMVILHHLLDVGKEFFIANWSVWAIIVWAFLVCIHAFNVFFTNRFMGKDWENKQLDKLREKQRKRIAELQKKVERDIPLPTPSSPQRDNPK